MLFHCSVPPPAEHQLAREAALTSTCRERCNLPAARQASIRKIFWSPTPVFAARSVLGKCELNTSSMMRDRSKVRDGSSCATLHGVAVFFVGGGAEYSAQHARPNRSRAGIRNRDESSNIHMAIRIVGFHHCISRRGDEVCPHCSVPQVKTPSSHSSNTHDLRDYTDQRHRPLMSLI